MLFFIGPRRVVKTPARGLFHCPKCELSRAYAYRQVRRFLVLFFIPLVPLRRGVDFVQCGFCRRAFNAAILEFTRLAPPSGRAEDAGESGRRRSELDGAAASTLLVWEEDAA